MTHRGTGQPTGAPTAYRRMPLRVGDRAPDFELPDQDGRAVRLADLLGKKNVILAFFVLANTPT